MKWVYEGIEFEGTPQEYKILTDKSLKQKNSNESLIKDNSENKPRKIVWKKNSFKRYSRKEKAFIKENFQKPNRYLSNKLNRSIRGIINIKRRMEEEKNGYKTKD